MDSKEQSNTPSLEVSSALTSKPQIAKIETLKKVKTRKCIKNLDLKNDIIFSIKINYIS
jgi:hypothetical protein